jgi:nicotinate-nucleotide adenylyltransferase
MSKQIALYFGSFNPVHLGHLSIANLVFNNNLCHEVWFVVSPQNPLKKNRELAEPKHRKAMLELATKPYPHMRVSDIEFDMPRPSYTINTLEKLSQLYPKDKFSIISGMDNLLVFKQWKQWEDILNNHTLLIYPRKQANPDDEISLQHHNIQILQNAPLLDFSSTTIRQKIQMGKDVKKFVPPDVSNYIKEHGLYTKAM